MTPGDPTTADAWNARLKELAAELDQAAADAKAANERVLALKEKIDGARHHYSRLVNKNTATTYYQN